MDAPNLFSRRRFLQQTFVFSALALTGLRRAARAATTFNPEGHHLFMFGDWGKKDDLAQQKAVAAAMRRYGVDHSIRPETLLLLGDNFYGQFDGGVHCPRWRTQFEEMYPPLRL